MYPYHNRIKQRIKNGELIGIEKGKGEFAVVFIFSTKPYRRPIRESSLWRYENISFYDYISDEYKADSKTEKDKNRN